MKNALYAILLMLALSSCQQERILEFNTHWFQVIDSEVVTIYDEPGITHEVFVVYWREIQDYSGRYGLITGKEEFPIKDSSTYTIGFRERKSLTR